MRSDLTVKDNNSRSFTINFKLDTGAEANVLPYSFYRKMSFGPMRTCSTVLCGFGNAMVKPNGIIFFKCIGHWTGKADNFAYRFMCVKSCIFLFWASRPARF